MISLFSLIILIVRYIFYNTSVNLYYYNINKIVLYNVNHKHGVEHTFTWQIINNIVSPFRNLCLETVARFLYDGGMCGFNKSTALSFLKYGGFLK